MQSRLQGLFLLILLQLYSLVNCQVAQVTFTNKLKVPVDVTAYYYADLLTDENEVLAHKEPKTGLASGASYEFPLRSGQPIRKIKTNAGGNLASCDVHTLFGGQVVPMQRLELLPAPEEEGTGTDSGLGYVKQIRVKNNFGAGTTAQVTAYYSLTTLNVGQKGDPGTAQTVAHGTTTTFTTKAAGNYVRRIEVATASADGTKTYTTVCNVQRRYGSDKVDLKYLEIHKETSLDIVVVRPEKDIPEKTGYVHSASVKNELQEGAVVKAYYSKNALPEDNEGSVQATPSGGETIIKGAKVEFGIQKDGPDNIPLRRIKSEAGGSHTKIDLDKRFGESDQIEMKYLRIVYQANPTG